MSRKLMGVLGTIFRAVGGIHGPKIPPAATA